MYIERWQQVPEVLKSLFRKAFADPLDAKSRDKRPSAATWSNIILAAPQKTMTKTQRFATPQPRIKFSNGYTVDINSSFVIDQISSNGAVAAKFGTVEKQGDKYIFRSESFFTIKYYNANKDSGSLKFGQTVELNNGTQIFISTRTHEIAQMILE
jgi:hypothetical protein